MGDPYPGKIKYVGDTKIQLSYTETVAAVAIGGWPPALWAKATAVISSESDRVANVYNTYLQGHYGLMQIGKEQHPEMFPTSGDPNNWMDPRVNTKFGYSIYQSQGWGAWESATNGRYAANMLQATAAVKAVQNSIAKFTLAPKALPTPGPHGQEEILQSYLAQKGDAIIYRLAIIELGSGAKSLVNNIGAAAEKTGSLTVAGGAAAAQATAAVTQGNALLGAVQMMVGAGMWVANPSNWLRVAQVLAGGALLIAGISIAAKPLTGQVAGLAGALPMGKIAKTAGKALG